MRLMCLDFGSRTVGVAVNDPLGLTAQGVEIIRRKDENHLRRTLSRIAELAQQYKIEAVVLGYPLNMDDTIGERAERTLDFQAKLKLRLHVPVYLCDERLTTVEADEIMDETGVKPCDRKKYIDMIAAQIILEDWMRGHKDG